MCPVGELQDAHYFTLGFIERRLVAGYAIERTDQLIVVGCPFYGGVEFIQADNLYMVAFSFEKLPTSLALEKQRLFIH